MTNLNNKTLLAAVTCAWLLTAAVFVVVRPARAGIEMQRSATAQR